MNCIYCKHKYVNTELAIPKCDDCDIIYCIHQSTKKIKEVLFFYKLNDKYTYMIKHNFEGNSTLIDEIYIKNKYVKTKTIFKSDLIDVNPLNVKHFFENKLKLYQLFL